MLITNEPGVYRPGEYGIRIENIMLVVPAEVTQFGEFYRFETLTLAPIQTRALVLSMLSQGDRAWLNAYHLRVAGKLGPLLPAADKDWLETACASV
jgi:Xaa-Pro aminopeptidase